MLMKRLKYFNGFILGTNILDIILPNIKLLEIVDVNNYDDIRVSICIFVSFCLIM